LPSLSSAFTVLLSFVREKRARANEPEEGSELAQRQQEEEPRGPPIATAYSRGVYEVVAQLTSSHWLRAEL